MAHWTVFTTPRKGVVIFSRASRGINQLSLNKGDLVQAVAESYGWYKVCFLVPSGEGTTTIKGLYPANHIKLEGDEEAIVEKQDRKKLENVRIVGTVDEVISNSKLLLAAESLQVIREWGTELHKLKSEKKEEKYQEIKRKMAMLVGLRKQYVDVRFQSHGGKMEKQELEDKIIKVIEEGSRQLNLDLIVRVASGAFKGQRAHEGNTSVPLLFAQYQSLHKKEIEARLKAETKLQATDIVELGVEKFDEEMSASDDKGHELSQLRQKYDLPTGKVQLLVDIQGCMFTVGEPTETYVSLYSRKLKKFLTEEYMVELSPLGMPTNIKLVQNIRTIFKDLTEQEYLQDMYLVIHIFRKGQLHMDPNAKVTTGALKGNETGYKRPFGISVMDLTPRIISENLLNSKQYLPGNLAIFAPKDETMFSTIHENIIAAALGGPNVSFEKVPGNRAIGIAVGVTLFAGSHKQTMEDNKLVDISETNMLDFLDVIPASCMRNDLYITVQNGNISETQTAMIQAKLILKLDPSSTPQPCISRFTQAFSDPQPQYESCVYNGTHTPTWNELIRINLSSTDLEQAVLVFYVYNCPSKRSPKMDPYCVAFFHLTDNGVMKQDEKYTLDLYKYHKDMEKSLYKYVKDDAGIKGLNKLKSSTITLKTILLSTKATQDAALNSLLKWKNAPNIEMMLENMKKISTASICKYIREIFDALFNIMVQNEQNEKVAAVVYRQILGIIDQLSKKQFAQYRPVIDEYISDFFRFPNAYKWVLRYLTKYLKYDEKNALSSSSMTSFHFLLQFVLMSRLQFENEAKDKKLTDRDEFLKQITYCIDTICETMAMQNVTSLIAAQDLTLKHIPSIFRLSAITLIIPSAEIGSIAKKLINSIPTTGRKLTIEGKLAVVHACVKGYLLDGNECREILLPTIITQLKQYFNQHNFELQCIHIFGDLIATLQRIMMSTSAKPEDIRKSLQVLTEVWPEAFTSLKSLQQKSKELLVKQENAVKDYESSKNNETGGREQLSELNLVKATIDQTQELRGELVSTFLGFFHMLDFDMVAKYIEFGGEQRITRFFEFLEAIEIFYDSPIPEYWIAFNVFYFNNLLQVLTIVSQYLKKKYLGNSFDFKMWKHFFDTMIRYIQAPPLQLEKFTATKQIKVLSLIGDLRVTMIRLFASVWESLDKQQIHFVPNLITPVLQLANIPKKEVYLDALTIYCSIIVREFTHTGSLKQCEGLTVAVLDDFLVREIIDDNFKKCFKSVLEERFKSEPSIEKEGLRFLNSTDNLMQLIAAMQRYSEKEEDEKTNALIKVMDYVLKTGQEELFNKYLHLLAKTHSQINNNVEAALTLMLYANKLSFKENRVLPKFNEDFPEELEYQRKERIYFKCIDLFDKGRDWERGIKYIRELYPIYENELYDYKKLGECFRRQGDLFEKIACTKRFFSSYFYVAYYGRGFDKQGLMNKAFIYKGNEAERLMDFVERIMKRFPNAEMLKPLEKPPQDIIESDGQYILISTVFPCSYRDMQSKLMSPKTRNPKVSNNIASYADFNEIKIFYFSKTFRKHPKDKQMNEQRDLFTTISFHVVCGEDEEKDPNRFINFAQPWFPTIIRRKEIKEVQEITLMPLENAVKNIEDKNVEVIDLLISHDLDAKPDTGKLSMQLNGIIDAAVMGGVTKYLDAFFVDEYIKSNRSEIPLIQRFQRALAEQLEILERGLKYYRKYGKQSTQKHVDHLDSMYIKMKEQLEPIIAKDVSRT